MHDVACEFAYTGGCAETISANVHKKKINAHTHDARNVFSFATFKKYRHPSDPSRSLIISSVPQPMHYLRSLQKLNIGEAERRLGERFREDRDVLYITVTVM